MLHAGSLGVGFGESFERGRDRRAGPVGHEQGAREGPQPREPDAEPLERLAEAHAEAAGVQHLGERGRERRRRPARRRLDRQVRRAPGGHGHAQHVDGDGQVEREAVVAPPVTPVPEQPERHAADRTGAPVAPALERLAAEERTQLRRRAEARARKVPVRLLFPLVFLVLPAFGLLTVVPALLAGFGRT